MTDYIILLVNRRSFLETPLFTKSWMAMNLTDDDLWNLQKELLKEPKKGSVIPGTGGLRKIRVPLADRGKRGSARACYVDFEIARIIYLVYCYPKNKKEDLTVEEKRLATKIIDEAKKELNEG